MKDPRDALILMLLHLLLIILVLIKVTTEKTPTNQGIFHSNMEYFTHGRTRDDRARKEYVK